MKDEQDINKGGVSYCKAISDKGERRGVSLKREI